LCVATYGLSDALAPDAQFDETDKAPETRRKTHQADGSDTLSVNRWNPHARLLRG
jgi:hypothetical protein